MKNQYKNAKIERYGGVSSSHNNSLCEQKIKNNTAQAGEKAEGNSCGLNEHLTRKNHQTDTHLEDTKHMSYLFIGTMYSVKHKCYHLMYCTSFSL